MGVFLLHSRTTIPAPSPSTKPERSLSKGIEVVDHNVFKTQFFLIHYWLLPSSELCRIAHYLGLRHVLLIFDLSPHLAVAHNIDTVGHS